MHNTNYFLLLALLLPLSLLHAKTVSIDIDSSSVRFIDSKFTVGKTLYLKNGIAKNGQSFYFKTVPLSRYNVIKSVSITNATYFPIKVPSNFINITKISTTHKIIFETGTSDNETIGYIYISPLIKTQNGYSILNSFTVNFSTEKKKSRQNYTIQKSFKNTSVLASGDWYKVGVTTDNMFKITYGLLNDLGINPKKVAINNIHVYGNGDGILPENNTIFRPDDLNRNPILIKDLDKNGSFDKNDYILFYGRSAHQWELISGKYRYKHNIYSDTNFYFININPNLPPLSPTVIPYSSTTTNKISTTYDNHQAHKKDLHNLVRGGKNWVGEQMSGTTELNFPFTVKDIDNTASTEITVSAVGRSSSGSNMIVQVDSRNSFNLNFSSTNLLSNHGPYASKAIKTGLFNNLAIQNEIIKLNIKYNKNVAADIAWIDYIQLVNRRAVRFDKSSTLITFRDKENIGKSNITKFEVYSSFDKAILWDVTTPYQAKKIEYTKLGTDKITFNLATDTLREFVLFNPEKGSDKIYPYGKVENQNLHGLPSTPVITITHKSFYNQAKELTDFHKDNDNLQGTVVTVSDIYNEFSSGRQDITAIRDFIRMMYQKGNGSNRLKYLILFGDGSYDYKNILPNNSNYVPVYESEESINRNLSYTSDDFFGLMDDKESKPGYGGAVVDFGIGRLTAKSPQQAQDIVDKIKTYVNSTSKRDWRNLIVLVSDDGENGDGNIFIKESEAFEKVLNKDYNVEKVYLDAFKQFSTPGGKRYPNVQEVIRKKFEEGSLLINFTGHGGPVGITSERILTIADINSWKNTDRFPVFFTATCQFTRLDDLNRNSAGEYILQKKNGAAIALFTTVRDVGYFTSNNINNSFFADAFTPLANGEMPRIGDLVYSLKKQYTVGDYNYFLLMGDPVLRMGYPKYQAKTDSVNGKIISTTDTIRALEKVTIAGKVQNNKGTFLSNYNGTLYPTVYDKAKVITTLNNDNSSDGTTTFKQQINKLFKGRAKITNGKFKFEFIVPKDINYDFGKIKLSYYFENGNEDGHGNNESVTLGGLSKNPIKDTKGPECTLYMNDKDFIDGGVTNTSPVFHVDIFDNTGVNTVGNGIGHDISLTLDNDSKNTINLNNHYESAINSYQKGNIQYPFKDLTVGKHRLNLKIWDVNNNSSDYSINFEVIENKDIEIRNVLNYPNPFSTNTEFWFEHNHPNRRLFALVQIFTISGKLVKTIQKDFVTEGFRYRGLVWNGLDDFGQKLAKGVYIYKLTVRSDNFSTAEKYEKLVIL